jgi:hypothetical protein
MVSAREFPPVEFELAHVGCFPDRGRLLQRHRSLIAGGCFPAASSLTGLGLALAKERSHGAVCWPRRIPEGDEPLRGAHLFRCRPLVLDEALDAIGPISEAAEGEGEPR